MRAIKIAPSILSADFSQLGQQIKLVEFWSDYLHLDVMDGHFVPNLTIGPVVVKTIRKVTQLKLDVHLMVTNPEQFIIPFAQAGSDLLSFHLEVSSPRKLSKVISKIRNLGVKPVISLNPETSWRKVIDFLPLVDMVTLMSVRPGFGGQKFVSSVLKKIERLNNYINKKNFSIDIEVDGGVNLELIPAIVKAGANVLVAGYAIFGSRDIKGSIQKIRKKAQECWQKYR